jgi:cytochrome P450
MREATDRAIDRWPTDEVFALLPEMQAITLDVIARAVFGVEEGARQEELKARIRGLLEPRNSRLSLFLGVVTNGRIGRRAWERFLEQRDRVTEAILAEIARRRAEPALEEREDVLSMLLLARDEDGDAMTDGELRDELVTLLMAGHETTATALAWTFELLLRNPPARRRLESEVEDGGHAYTDAVIKESLRIRPVVPGLGRKVRGEPFQLGEYSIPPGIEINPSILVIHRRADRYPDHERFDPERFLGPDAPDTYTWIPFGGGTRRCLGASFAMFEMRLVVRRVLERVLLQLADDKPEKAVRREVTVSPRHGVRVRVASISGG